jgi:hypothetical protein
VGLVYTRIQCPLKPITNPKSVYSHSDETISLSVSHFHFNSKTLRSIQGTSHESLCTHTCNPTQEHSSVAVHGQPRVGSRTWAPETNTAGSYTADEKQFKNLMQATSNAETTSSGKNLQGFYVHTQIKKNSSCWKFYGKSLHFLINPLKNSGYYMYHLLRHTENLHPAQRAYLCFSYGSHNKQR